MPISIDLHVKCPFYKKWNKKKTPIFFLVKFSHCIWGANSYIYILPKILSQGAVKKKKKKKKNQ